MLLDMNIFSHPKELILRMEELDIIELDLDDEKYYLTENGYKYFESDEWNVTEYKDDDLYASTTHYLYKKPKEFKYYLYLLIPAIIITVIINYNNSRHTNLDLPSGTMEIMKKQIDSLINKMDSLPKQTP